MQRALFFTAVGGVRPGVGAVIHGGGCLWLVLIVLISLCIVACQAVTTPRE